MHCLPNSLARCGSTLCEAEREAPGSEDVARGLPARDQNSGSTSLPKFDIFVAGEVEPTSSFRGENYGHGLGLPRKNSEAQTEELIGLRERADKDVLV